MRVLTLFVLMIIMTSCSEKSKLPLPDEKVVAILADRHIVDEMCDYFSDPIQKDSVRTVYMQKLYDIHSIDSTTYVSIFEYLEKNMEKYKDIEGKVHERLKDLHEAD